MERCDGREKVGKLKENLGQLIDLPGVYDLSPITKDETVVTEFLMETSFTGMINIIDTSQIKKKSAINCSIARTQCSYNHWFKHDGCSYSTWFKD